VEQKPKYEQVKDILRERIRSSAVGSRIPSIAKLNRELGVSPGTVNRAVSDLVEEGILERRARRGTFVTRPNKPTRNIGFIWPGVMERLTKHPSAGTILHGVQEEARSHNRHLLVASNTDSAHPPFIKGDGQVAGVVVLFNYDRHLVEGYIGRGIPVVLIVPLVRVEGVPFVASDHHSGMYGATMHLVKLGHRRIVHVTLDLPDCIPVDEKIRGYSGAMRDADLEQMAHVYRGRAEPWDEADDAAFLEMLRDVGATGCCCFDDEVAAYVIRICLERGIRIPSDVSVVGYDDSSILNHTWPAMTTVHVQLEEMGRVAVQVLDKLIEERRLTGHGIVLPTRLVERASSAPPASGASEQVMSVEKFDERTVGGSVAS